ncbi:hypothetical protein [Streptomyces sp. NPDC057280]|uniref:hypothetical protein n=1 Tax=Streptomyces sp. NPDC057280 TaxID=3346081 RepID=UPI00363BBE64
MHREFTLMMMLFINDESLDLKVFLVKDMIISKMHREFTLAKALVSGYQKGYGDRRECWSQVSRRACHALARQRPDLV